jgi:hypothetical protein
MDCKGILAAKHISTVNAFGGKERFDLLFSP